MADKTTGEEKKLKTIWFLVRRFDLAGNVASFCLRMNVNSSIVLYIYIYIYIYIYVYSPRR